MSVTRFVLTGHALAPGQWRIAGPAAHHARVARVDVGETIEVLDLAGTVGLGTLCAWEGKACLVEVVEVIHERGEPREPLILALGVLHTQAFDWAVEKATECGATVIVPLLSARVQGGRHAARVDRWRRIAEAAVVQCGRSRVPAVREPEGLAGFLANAEGLCLVADAAAAGSPGGRTEGRGVAVLVGPEGGFTDEERVEIAAAGFLGVALGPRTLRAETAALAALVVAQRIAAWI
jgi:16S rRNA (uracil1498-N3)-methyltransferase